MTAIADFEKRPGLGSAASLVASCLSSPATTFSSITPEGRVMPALMLGFILCIASLGVEVATIRSDLVNLSEKYPQLINPVLDSVRKEAKRRGLQDWLEWSNGPTPWVLIWVLGAPLAVIGLVATGVGLHVCMWLVGAGGGGLGATLRVAAYSGTSSILGPIPMIGPVLVLIFVSIQQLTGFSTVHRTTVLRVALGLCLPLASAAAATAVVIGWVLTSIR